MKWKVRQHNPTKHPPTTDIWPLSLPTSGHDQYTSIFQSDLIFSSPAGLRLYTTQHLPSFARYFDFTQSLFMLMQTEMDPTAPITSLSLLSRHAESRLVGHLPQSRSGIVTSLNFDVDCVQGDR